MRDKQKSDIVSLKELRHADVGMQTTVFIGSSASERYLDFMYTPRGYKEKYGMGKE